MRYLQAGKLRAKGETTRKKYHATPLHVSHRHTTTFRRSLSTDRVEKKGAGAQQIDEDYRRSSASHEHGPGVQG